MTVAPDFFHVRLSQIQQCVERVQRGTVEEIARSAGGHPVWAVSYGEANPSVATTNFSGISGSRNPSAYLDESMGKQSIVLIAGCHGSEAEATAACVNLIYLLEDGKDLRGEEDPDLFSLTQHYRLVIIPCLNPDGRDNSPVCMDDVPGGDYRAACRGTWKGGQPIEYPACKDYQPYPLDQVEHRGGYPNAGGYNIMHDVTPGDIKTAEARALLRLVDRERADLCLHLHGHRPGPVLLGPNMGCFALHRQRILAYRRRCAEALHAAGISAQEIPVPDPSGSEMRPLNLASMTALTSGALSGVFEQPIAGVPFTERIQTTYEVIRVFMRHGLDELFAPRLELFDCVIPVSDDPSCLLVKNKL